MSTGPGHANQIVFLTDARTVSAAETVMGIVAAHGVGAIVVSDRWNRRRRRTVHRPRRIQHLHDRSQDHEPRWHGHHGVGVQPTVPIERTIADVTARADEVLEAAIGLLTR